MKTTPTTKIVLAVAIAAASASGAEAHATRCEGTVDLLGVTNVTPKLENHVLTLELEGKTLEALEQGSQTVVTASALDIPLYTETIDLCSQQGVECPIPAGTKFTFVVAHNVPRELPSSLDLDVQIETFNGVSPDKISCLETDAKSSDHVLASPKSGVLSASQGLQTELSWELHHFEFLFKKWLTHFESMIPVAIDNVEHRFAVFRDNLKKIVMHNLSGATYTMGMNQFGHMTQEEFASTMLGGFRAPEKSLRGEQSRLPRSIHKYEGEQLPDTVDWVAKGAVTPVKNQGACGSCWSFSATGALEGAYFLKTGKLVSFSEEQLVTCDHGDMGCNGGLMDNAFKWIEQNGGSCKEEDAPYVSGNGAMPACGNTCKPVEGSKIASFVDVDHTEEGLESAVAKTPVAIAIEADQGAFQFYNGGVLTQRCGTQLDHGVLAVGYGTLDGTKYWKVKNSWGPSWGVKGYINIERGLTAQEGGECGILMSASYPTL